MTRRIRMIPYHLRLRKTIVEMTEDAPVSDNDKILKIATPDRIRRANQMVSVIYGLTINRGVEESLAMSEIRDFVSELMAAVSPYGRCPHCDSFAVSRERRPNGNDTCASGHVYPSTAARY